MVRGRAFLVILLAVCWMAGSVTRTSVASEKIFSFRVDPEIGFIRLKGETTLHSLKANAKNFSGKGKVPEPLHGPGVSVRVVIKADSLTTGNFLLNSVMRRSVLDVEQYPEIVFYVDTVVAEEKDPAPGEWMKLTLKGRLDLHGVTKEMTFPVTVKRVKEGFTVSGSFPIRLSEHKIPDPSVFFNKVKDKLTVSFQLTLVPASEK